jgi:CubicO group peptidase (beta-lactamase class C family)
MPFRALSRFVEELLAVRPLPGLSLAVTDRDRVLATATFGHADLAARRPVAPETVFELGSIGKTFTAVLLLQLRDEGLIDLQASVARYLPWFDVRSQHGPIALHHLLTHTAGIVVGSDASADSRFDVWALRETETGFPPGERFHYSNVGYRTLGYLLEEATGRPYPQLLRERILEPLGMTATDPAVTSETRKRLAVGHERWYDDRPHRRDDPWVPATWLETSTADGSLAGPAHDLAVFLRALLNRGRRLLSEESFELMLREGDDWTYGYGLESRGRLVRHGGSMPGFGSTMLGDLEAGLGVVVLVNSTDEGNLTEEVAEVALDLYRGATTPPAVADPLVVENAEDYAGAYSGAGRRLVVSAEGERLLVEHSGGRVALERRRGDRFLVDHPDFALFSLAFERENDTVIAASHGSEAYVREGARRLDAGGPPPGWSAYPGHYRAYNPWLTNFRIRLRRDRLVFAYPKGAEDALTPLEDGLFRVGEDEWSPERLRLDAVVDGHALRANLSGCDYLRVSQP